MKIFKGRSGSYTLFFAIFAIGSFYACHCGDKEKSELRVVLADSGSKSFQESVFKGCTKALSKTTEEMTHNLLQAPTDELVDRCKRVVGAVRRYTQFRNPGRVLNVDLLRQLQGLLDQVLIHARDNECDYADYVVIVHRVIECVEYEKHRFEMALSEYNRTFRGTISRSLLQRTVGLATSPYDVPSIVQIIEWIIADLEELQARSQYSKGFDVEHYKKVICYLQADLDTLFSHLKPLI